VDISKEIHRNRILLVVLDEEEYENEIGEMLKSLGKLHEKVCYVCLNKPYKDVVEALEIHKVSAKNFFFIDVLSSYYKKQEPVKNCIFVPAPNDMGSILAAISRAVEENGCRIVVFDTFSTFLIYKQNYMVLKFAYRVLQRNPGRRVRNIMITLKGGNILVKERDDLIKDLIMFSDLSITMETERKRILGIKHY